MREKRETAVKVEAIIIVDHKRKKITYPLFDAVVWMGGPGEQAGK
jgi:hypothetical protein